MNELDDYFWDDLLEFIEDEKVIPIIGPQFVTVETEAGEVGFYRALADQLAACLRLKPRDLPEDFTLNDVVLRFLENRGKQEEIYRRIKSLLKDVNYKPSQALLDLASIGKFKLFISFTFDSLMLDALNAVRFGGAARTEELAYSPQQVQDLAVEKKKLTAPLVYHFLGKLSASPDYVVCDEDMLEFIKAMQTDSRKPHLLFDELDESHLLFLGCDYSDWLIRFLLRTSRNQALSQRREYMEVLIGENLPDNQPLVEFLGSFSYNTKIVPATGAEFVKELAKRWLDKHPPSPEAPADSAGNPPSTETDPLQMPPGGIFLSYASDDVEPVTKIKLALETAGLEVWFDKNRLTTGDDWDLKIRRNVGSCSLFMPVVSKSTEARAEGYFRREWAWAADRAIGIADGVPFLIPLVIDDTPPYNAKTPERFKANQFTHLPEGEASPEFVEQVKQLVRDFHRRQRGAG